MAFDGLDADVQLTGDACVGAPLRHQREDITFAIGQPIQIDAAATPAEKSSDDLGIDDRFATGAPVQRIE